MSMNSFQIKLIAIITMVIDHVGLFFFPNILLFRMVGRLSFPLFSWLIANGAVHTHNEDKYRRRIIIFAFISHIPYYLANWRIGIEPDLNVLFTFYFALLAIKSIRIFKNKILQILIPLIIIITAQLLRTDYGGMGVLSTIVFYLFFNNFSKTLLLETIVYTLGNIVPLASLLLNNTGNIPSYFLLIGPLALISLLFIYLYNGKLGPKTKYLFYIFYPVQYVIFFLILELFPKL